MNKNTKKRPQRPAANGFFHRYIIPDHLTQTDGIAYWQERVLLILLAVSAIAGLITYLPSVWLSIKQRLWIIAVLDTVMYGYVLFLFFRPDLPYRFRAVPIPVLAYVLGMVLLITLGPFGAGPVWLFFFPLITAVLLGSRPAGIALAINALTITVLGFLIYHNLTDLLSAFNFAVWHLALRNPLEKWVVISLNFLFINTIATVCVTMVLNGLQKSVKEVERSGEKYRQIFENILDVYFETSPEGTVKVVSPSVETISGYKTDELRGVTLSDLYADPDTRHQTLSLLKRQGFLNDHEVRLKDKSGRVHDCSVNARLIRNSEGAPDRIIGILRDISDKKAMELEKQALEERLNRSRKMEALGLLAGGVAHDLNNILSGVVTYPEILCMDLSPDDPMYKSLEIVRSSGLKASEIVQDLLTLSRRGVVSKEALNLNELVNRFLFSPEYEKILSFHPHVFVEKELSAELPFVNGSRVHLEKALMNLVSNAAEAQPDSGTITIRTLNRHLDTPLNGYQQIERGDYLVLSVQDRGSGIPAEDLKRIFEPFFTKKAMGRSGTGLGMAVVWGTMQDHSGYIDITTSLTQGTTFELYFPVSRQAPVQQDTTVDLAYLKGSGETILIIDDIKSQRQIARVALEKLGYRTFSVGSGEAAVDFLKAHSADLLLLDMIMDPGIDGFETYRRILALNPAQKAIIASGYSQNRKVEQALALGAGQYLKKPYTLEKLGYAVKKELYGVDPEMHPQPT